MKRLVFVSLISLLVLNLSACNTLNGIGKDIKQGGAAIEKATR